MLRKLLGGGKIPKEDSTQEQVIDREDTGVIEEGKINEPSSIEPCVKKQIDDIIENTPTDIVKYMIIKIFKQELSIQVQTHYGSFSDNEIQTGLLLKNDSHVDTIILEIIQKFSDISYGRDGLKIGGITFNIKNSIGELCLSYKAEKINEADLLTLKKIIQEHIIPKCESPDKKITGNDIVDALGLERKNLLHNDSEKFKLSLPLDSHIQLDNMVVARLLTKIGNYSSDYFIKPIDEYSFNNTVNLQVQDSNKGNGQYRIKITCDGKDLQIDVSTFSTTVQKKFLSEFLKSVIHEILKLQDNGESALQKLESLGVQIIQDSGENMSLEEITLEEGFVGYEDIKDEIDTKIITPWKNKDSYSETTAKHFPHIKSIVPNHVIFEGGPGTGKTTQGRIIGKYLGYPFIYIPINSITSKWYGESESRLNEIFELAGKVSQEYGGAVLMIDEIDEIGGNRDESHEATGRVTGVLLKKLDGIERINNILLIASTNRIDKLDRALKSRSNLNLKFRNPNTDEISAILNHYIPNLGILEDQELNKLEGLSGRNLSNLAKDYVSYLLKIDQEADFKDSEYLMKQFQMFLSKYKLSQK